MTEAVFVLLVASGLCLTFSAITTLYAIRTLDKARLFLAAAWDLLESNNADDFRNEGTD